METGLVEHIQKFLLELGQGFAFVGRQVHLEIGSEDFYLDLLLYHLKLRRYIAIELKARKFLPKDAWTPLGDRNEGTSPLAERSRGVFVRGRSASSKARRTGTAFQFAFIEVR